MAKKVPEDAVGILSADGLMLFVVGSDACWWEVAGDCGRFAACRDTGLPLGIDGTPAVDDDYTALTPETLGREIAKRNLN